MGRTQGEEECKEMKESGQGRGLAKEEKRWRGQVKRGEGVRGRCSVRGGIKGWAGVEEQPGPGRPGSGVSDSGQQHLGDRSHGCEGRLRPTPGRGIHAKAKRRGCWALTGSLGLTSPLQKWQKNRCAATVAPEPAPAAEASAIFLFRRGGPRGQPARPSPGRYLPAGVASAAASVAASSLCPAAPEPRSVT